MIDDDSLFARSKNNDSLVEFSQNNSEEEYRVRVSNFFKPNEKKSFNKITNDNNNNANSKIIKNNSFSYKPRFFGKTNVSSSNTKILKVNNQTLKYSYDKESDNNSNINNRPLNGANNLFWEKGHLNNNNNNNFNNGGVGSFNSSILSSKDPDSLLVSGNNQTFNFSKKNKKLQENSLKNNKFEKIIDTHLGTEDLHEMNSVKRWSNQLNNQQTSFGYVENKVSNNLNNNGSTLDEKQIMLNNLTRTENKKVKFDKTNQIKTPTTISKLIDIIEREGTTFSIKMAYDNPFITERLDALSPHTYLDLDVDPNLELARQNTFMNKMIDFDISDNNNNNSGREKSARLASKSPFELYQKLNNPLPLGMYSELNTSIEQAESYRAKPKKQISKNRNYIKVKTKKSQHLKLDKNSKKKDLIVDDNLIVESMIEYKMIEKKEIDTLSEELTASMAEFQSSSIYQSKKELHVGKNDSKLLEALIATAKLRDVLKEPQIKDVNSTFKIPSSHNQKSSSKSQNKSKGTTNKKTIKEFKYCILTDLKIGEGEFSETFQGYRYDLGPPLKIAAKRLKNASKEKDDQNTINLLSEISVLTQLGKHDNVIEYLGVHNLNNEMYMVFEYAEKGDLKRLLDLCRKNSKREYHISNLYKLRIAYEIASGMEYISSLDIVHKDLATRNILLDKEFSCKISDFGINQPFKKVPIRWMAPESINKLLFTPASDVWSYGVLLWEVWTFGMIPYPGMTDDEVIGRINQWYRLYKPNDCPNEVYNIMLNCWKEYHKARPKFTNLKNKFKELHKQMSEPV